MEFRSTPRARDGIRSGREAQKVRHNSNCVVVLALCRHRQFGSTIGGRWCDRSISTPQATACQAEPSQSKMVEFVRAGQIKNIGEAGSFDALFCHDNDVERLIGMMGFGSNEAEFSPTINHIGWSR